MSEAPVIECAALVKRFDQGPLAVEVLKGIDLRIERGEQIAIVGISGAGKTTLLHMLGGLDSPSAGCVRVGGHDLARVSERRRSALRNRLLGFVYQFHHLLPEFSAEENVAMPLLIGRLAPEQAPPFQALLGRVTAAADGRARRLVSGRQFS